MTLRICLLLLLTCFGSFVTAGDSMDSKTKAALYEIERAENQIKSAAPGQTAKLTRIQRMLESADAQLQASGSKDDAGWKDARARLDALNEAMTRLKQPPPAAPAGNQLSDADLGLLGSIDRRTEGLKRELNTYDTADIKRLGDKLRGMIANLKAEYQRLANPAHPQAIAVAQKVLAEEKRIVDALAAPSPQAKPVTTEKRTAAPKANVVKKPAPARAKQAANAGPSDLDESLERIHARLNPSDRGWFGSPVPDAPFTIEKVTQFAEMMKDWRAKADVDLEYLKDAALQVKRSDVTDLLRRVEHEIGSIDRYNDQMVERLENQLAGADQLVGMVDTLADRHAAPNIPRIEAGLALLDVADALNESLGKTPNNVTQRRKQYSDALTSLRAKEKKATSAAKAVPQQVKKSAAKKKIQPQRIEMFGTRLIEITAEGEVWVDGDKAGDITADGEIWVAGDKEGDVTADGEVWKAGNKVGDVTKDGGVWREGNHVGNVEADGTIWVDGSRQGTFKGGNPAHAAAVVFFGFFGI